MVETPDCLHPHIFFLSAWTPKGLTLSPVIHRPCRDQEEICFGVRLAAPPQGLRSLKDAFEYASRSFLDAVALCCDLRCKIKQN